MTRPLDAEIAPDPRALADEIASNAALFLRTAGLIAKDREAEARGIVRGAATVTLEAVFRCNAVYREGFVDCVLPKGHEGEHLSTTGCAGSVVRWTTWPEDKAALSAAGGRGEK